MTSSSEANAAPRSDAAWVVGPALGVLLFHLLLYRGYGYFRDELYFLACSRHLAWGYVDQPPMVALAAWLGRRLFGETLFAIRSFPAIFGALTVEPRRWPGFLSVLAACVSVPCLYADAHNRFCPGTSSEVSA